MIPSFKDLSLENGTIIKRVKSEDIDFREYIPVKFITKITTKRVHIKKFRTISFVMGAMTAFALTISFLKGEFTNIDIIAGAIGASVSAIYFIFYKRNRIISLNIRFNQGDDFNYLYAYSSDDYNQLCSFVDCVLKEISHGTSQIADDEVPEFGTAA